MKTPHLTLIAVIVLLGSCQVLQKSAQKDSKNTVIITDQAHNASNALDWAGTYQGTLPCADCSGIETTIALHSDKTYSLSTRYLGKNDEAKTTKGTFEWNEAGNTIRLSGNEREPLRYFVGENTLTQLDMEGNKISGSLAALYVLKKVANPELFTDNQLTGVKWELTELFGKAIAPEAGRKAAFIVFEAQDNRMHGSGSCNNFNGAYELKQGQRISMTGLATTMMACPDMSLEQEFFNVLNSCDNYTVADGILSLNKARMAPMARLKAVPKEN